jgi:hypothetical protein
MGRSSEGRWNGARASDAEDQLNGTSFTLATMHRVASAYGILKQFDKSSHLYFTALKISKGFYGEESKEAAHATWHFTTAVPFRLAEKEARTVADETSIPENGGSIWKDRSQDFAKYDVSGTELLSLRVVEKCL